MEFTDKSLSFSNGFELGVLHARMLDRSVKTISGFVHPHNLDDLERMCAKNGCKLVIGEPVPGAWMHDVPHPDDAGKTIKQFRPPDGKHVTQLKDGSLVVQEAHDKIKVTIQKKA